MSANPQDQQRPPEPLQRLRTLRSSLRTAEGRDRKVDLELFRLFILNQEDRRAKKSLDFTSSLDTALDLLGHVLPQWGWHGSSWSVVPGGHPRSKMQITRPKLTTWSFFDEPGMGATGEGNTPALAIIDALLATRIADAEANSEEREAA